MAKNLGTYANPVNGGWYNNPQGQNQQWLNGQWQNAPGGSNPLSAYQAGLNDLNNLTNTYYNQQQGFDQQQHDINSTLYNTNNTLAMGTQSPDAQSAFLNSVYTPDMKNQGAIEYGYNMNLGNENAMYGLQNKANTQNRQLALNKLANDENFAMQGLNFQQGNQNASTIDSLNQRGLLYGQSPTGAYQGNAMGGMNGLAGQQSGLVNTDFGIQKGTLNSDYGLNVQGTNNQYNQLQASQDQTHNYNVQNLGYGAANSLNTQNANYTHDTALNNNQLAMAQADLKQKQYQDQQRNKQTMQVQTGSSFQG